MADLTIPNGWVPRAYQRPLWDYLELGGKRAVAVWHRRSGKDSCAMNFTATAMLERTANYWHMLPTANQGRKVIWDAIDPHTGKRLIDQAFPHALRAGQREDEMSIKLKTGSMWQVVGSDNFNSLIGSPPAGVVFSEYSVANPRAWDYIRPILAENNGWALFIYTPRGKNHGEALFKVAKSNPDWFAQILTVEDTGAVPADRIAQERREGMPEEMIEQEYFCSFQAALVGAYYGKEMVAAEKEGRIATVPYEPSMPVHTAWDLGFDDDTSIWFFQVMRGGAVHVIDYYENHGQNIEHYADVIHLKEYNYGWHWLPWDAEPKTLAAAGRSIKQQLWALNIKGRITPNLDRQDGIQAARKTLPRCRFDAEKCAKGIDALSQYQREWDDERKIFHDKPKHDWTSHAADAFRYLSLVWKEPPPVAREVPGRRLAVGPTNTMTLDDAWATATREKEQRL